MYMCVHVCEQHGVKCVLCAGICQCVFSSSTGVNECMF